LDPLAAAQATETDERLIEAVRQDPDAAAELLKKWLGRAA
jgi:flagellar biosynthesis/type III secretory pathway M-ring protein FliF/YscJ